MKKSIPRNVATELGYYVYLYVDPRDESVFYVGKGKGSRILSHLNKSEEFEIAKIIKKIKAQGEEPKLEILAHSLPTEKVALQVEASAIDLLGVNTLTNTIRGYHGAKFGRMALQDVIALYNKKHANIKERSVLIRISKQYHYGITEQDLYDATRSAWKISKKKRESIEYAFAIFEGVIREVYKVTGWHEGGTTFNKRYEGFEVKREGRWEFVGVLADEKVRKRYVNFFIGHVFSQYNQNPIRYINID